VEYDVLFLHYVFLLRLWQQLPIVKNVFHVYSLEILAVESLTSNDKTAELTLLQRLFEDVLLDRVDGNEPVDVHCFGLADSVTAVLSLFVHGRVPVSVVKNNAVSASQVDADSSAASAADKAKQFGRQIESVDHLLAGFNFDRSVESYVRVSVQIQKLLKNVQHPCHLGKY
jgi:hypothetical protein